MCIRNVWIIASRLSFTVFKNERRLIRRFIEMSEKIFVQNTKYIYLSRDKYIYVFWKLSVPLFFVISSVNFTSFSKHIFVILQYPQRTIEFAHWWKKTSFRTKFFISLTKEFHFCYIPCSIYFYALQMFQNGANFFCNLENNILSSQMRTFCPKQNVCQ